MGGVFAFILDCLQYIDPSSYLAHSLDEKDGKNIEFSSGKIKVEIVGKKRFICLVSSLASYRRILQAGIGEAQIKWK